MGHWGKKTILSDELSAERIYVQTILLFVCDDHFTHGCLPLSLWALTSCWYLLHGEKTCLIFCEWWFKCNRFGLWVSNISVNNKKKQLQRFIDAALILGPDHRGLAIIKPFAVSTQLNGMLACQRGPYWLSLCLLEANVLLLTGMWNEKFKSHLQLSLHLTRVIIISLTLQQVFTPQLSFF